MGMCPVFQCSFCLPGLGPCGGPCVALLARVGAIWWPLSIAEVLGLVWLSLKGVCVSFVSVLFLLARVGAIWWPLCSSACNGWGHLVAPVRPWRLIFDVFEAAGVTFLSILASFWEAGLPVATFQALLAPEAPRHRKLCEKWLQNGSPFWDPFGRLAHPWAPCGSPWSQNGAKSGPKLEFVDFLEMSVLPR